MILNAHTDPHETRLRVKPRPYRAAPCLRVDEQGVRLDPNGSLDERCAWMRERERKRRREKQGPPESNVAPQR